MTEATPTKRRAPTKTPFAANSLTKTARDASRWWNKPLASNLTDDEFRHAALMKRFAEARDPTLNVNRRNALPLLTQLFGDEIAGELSAYRKERDETE